MEKQLGQEFKSLVQRETFLRDNCDGSEMKGYMKPYTPEELQGHKEKLASIFRHAESRTTRVRFPSGRPMSPYVKSISVILL